MEAWTIGASVLQVAAGYVLTLFTEKYLRIREDMIRARRATLSARPLIKETVLRLGYFLIAMGCTVGSFALFPRDSLGTLGLIAGVALRAPRFYRNGKAEGWLQ